jgi:hypothetical protein
MAVGAGSRHSRRSRQSAQVRACRFRAGSAHYQQTHPAGSFLLLVRQLPCRFGGFVRPLPAAQSAVGSVQVRAIVGASTTIGRDPAGASCRVGAILPAQSFRGIRGHPAGASFCRGRIGGGIVARVCGHPGANTGHPGRIVGAAHYVQSAHYLRTFARPLRRRRFRAGSAGSVRVQDSRSQSVGASIGGALPAGGAVGRFRALP